MVFAPFKEAVLLLATAHDPRDGVAEDGPDGKDVGSCGDHVISVLASLSVVAALGRT
jgi:hypothetical protein